MATYKRQNLNKKYFLENSNDGLDFYNHVLGDLSMLYDDKCKNTYNPFYEDNKPSFSVYKKGGIWRHFDHGDSSCKGDVFDFAAQYFEMELPNQFFAVLKKMCEELEIPIKEEETEVDDIVREMGYLIPVVRFNDVKGLRRAHEYFEKFGITMDILRDYGVRAISQYYWLDQNEDVRSWYFKKEDLAIVYEDINHFKIYRPLASEFRFLYRGNKDPEFVFGQKQIIRRALKAKYKNQRELLIITGGEKDALTLTALNYDAIALNSETMSQVPVQLENSILLSYRYIVVLYDLDETGKKQAGELQKRHGFKVCTLPEELSEAGGKDVSDYVALGLDIEKLNKTIEDAAQADVFLPFIGNKIRPTRIKEGFINGKGEFVNVVFAPKVQEPKDQKDGNDVGRTNFPLMGTRWRMILMGMLQMC